jgi:DNA topoisomerase-1
MHVASDEERKRLKVPPAWRDVHVADHASARLTVLGTDKAGRVQRRYSAEHSDAATVAKFTRLREFHAGLPSMQKAFERDAAGNGKNRDHAAALRLIHATGFRPGSDADTRAKTKAYGATTLRKEHVSVKGDAVHFDFIGKEGVRQQHSLKNAAIARDVKARLASRRDRLFDTNDAKLRDYLHSIDGEFKVKDFRTWRGTATAQAEVRKMHVPRGEKDRAKAKLQVATVVSKVLGNRPQQALKSYIDPHVFQSWEGAE